MGGETAKTDRVPASEAELVWDARCAVGESPVWDEARDTLWFCDIYEQAIHRLDLRTDERRSYRLPDRVCSFCICRSGRLLVALRDRIVLWEPDTERIEPFVGPLRQPGSMRLNDGKLGPDGAFWVGSMVEHAPRHAAGALWRVTPDRRATRMAAGYVITNGLAWSPDGTAMWHSDTGAKPAFVEMFDFDRKAGEIGGARRLAAVSDTEGLPDGAAALADGSCLYAGVGAFCLHRFSLEGRIVATYPMPVPSPTMPCVAGAWVYVTSLRRGVAAAALAMHPSSGGLFRLPAPAAGVPLGVFDA